MSRLVLSILIAASTLAAAASARAEATLRPVAVVKASVIRIGDLFVILGDGTGEGV